MNEGITSTSRHTTLLEATQYLPAEHGVTIMSEPRKTSLPQTPATQHSPLVSVIVPTKNSARYLQTCLDSILKQTYSHIECIVVDNYSTDDTRQIAQRYGAKTFCAGPERSAQVNRGVEAARGEFIFRVDADFRLDPHVVEECLQLSQQGADAIVVHNTADSSVGLLAKVRKFEVDMYKHSLEHTAARFLPRVTFLEAGGLREDVTAGEDYDFQNRLRARHLRIETANAEAVHLDEPQSIITVLRKYFNYGQDFTNYLRYNKSESKSQLNFFRREYIRNWRLFVCHPILGILFSGYHCSKFAAGALGYVNALVRGHSRHVSNTTSNR